MLWLRRIRPDYRAEGIGEQPRGGMMRLIARLGSVVLAFAALTALTEIGGVVLVVAPPIGRLDFA